MPPSFPYTGGPLPSLRIAIFGLPEPWTTMPMSFRLIGGCSSGGPVGETAPAHPAASNISAIRSASPFGRLVIAARNPSSEPLEGLIRGVKSPPQSEICNLKSTISRSGHPDRLAAAAVGIRYFNRFLTDLQYSIPAQDDVAFFGELRRAVAVAEDRDLRLAWGLPKQAEEL